MNQLINANEFHSYKKGKIIGKLKVYVENILKEINEKDNSDLQVDDVEIKLEEQSMYSEGFEKCYLINITDLNDTQQEILKGIPKEKCLIITYVDTQEEGNS